MNIKAISMNSIKLIQIWLRNMIMAMELCLKRNTQKV